MSVGWGQNEGDIIITEFFFNKSAGNLPEYVELFNKTELTIDLNGWKLEIDGIQVEIDVSFNIDSQDYVVILSSSGLFRSEDGTTYCSSSNYGFPFNVCDVTVDELFWRIGIESDSVPENHIVEECLGGYLLHDRIIRPAMVRVSGKN